MFCHSCGAQADNDAQFCPNCGVSLAAPGQLGALPPVPWTPPAGVQAQTGRWIGAGWNLVKADLGNFALVTLVYMLLNSVPLIQGALLVGMHIYCMKKLLARRAEFADLFTGFNFFVPSLVASLLISLFTFAGTLLCIIPGLVIAAMYKFTYLFIVDKRMDFWQAMKASHAVARNDYFGFTMFLLAMAGLNILGALCCVVGLLISIPVTIAAITVAYQEVAGFEQRTLESLA
jgi:uncharacterized membrane protein